VCVCIPFICDLRFALQNNVRQGTLNEVTGEFQHGTVRLIWCGRAARTFRCRWETGARRVFAVNLNWLKTGEYKNTGTVCVYRAGPNDYFWPGSDMPLLIGRTDKVLLLVAHFPILTLPFSTVPLRLHMRSILIDVCKL